LSPSPGGSSDPNYPANAGIGGLGLGYGSTANPGGSGAVYYSW
jgi:hypothetical protein